MGQYLGCGMGHLGFTSIARKILYTNYQKMLQDPKISGSRFPMHPGSDR
jgi:hypothetical protein